MRIELSVRGFVEFMLRSGDIDNRLIGGKEDAMLEGARLHRKIQGSMGPDYRPEVKISHVITYPDYDVLIEGRADGVITRPDSGRVIIDEIKTSYKDLNRIEHPVPVHLAQAKCYAYFYAVSNGLDEIGIRMTYCNIKTEKIRYFHENFKTSTLKKWFDALMADYKKWADHEWQWACVRKESIQALVFPFEYREGQKELVGYTYRTFIEEKKLYLEAPTGVGKTISVIYPALKCMGDERTDKLFYLTAKTVTGTVAKETFNLLRNGGLKIKSAVVTAKEKICPLDECICNPASCPYAKGHYDRINDAVYDIITHEDSFDRETIASYALEHEVCPFEMELDLTGFADAIICDYNYLFDPYARLKRYFAEGSKGRYYFLVDEAHNLVDRGREMYSAALYKEDFLILKALMKDHSPRIASLSAKCNKILLEYKKKLISDENDSGYMLISESESEFIAALNRLQGEIGTYLEDNERSPVREELLPHYFEISAYLYTYDRMDPDHYKTYACMEYDSEGDDRFMIKEFCTDPGGEVKICLDMGLSAVLFSATFLPIQYYKKLLGGKETDYEVYAKSTFPPDNRLLLIGNEVTSRYTRRNPAEYKNIARYVHGIISVKPGKYMVFFPSYAFLRDVKDAYEELYDEEEGIEIMVQESRMRESEREDFLGAFLKETASDLSRVINMEIFEENDISFENVSDTLVGFCVMGGIFSEGIDLKQDALIGAIIVGTGIPQIGPERDILKKHFDSMGENGFDYAYRFPGMNKVLQAAGRVIRTSEDTGVIALLDERFGELNYKRLFPREWKNIKTVSITQVEPVVEEFWEIH